MQTYIVLIACVILLLCLFFRVPVYISVFAAALTYFLFQTGSSPAIIAQRIGGGIQSIYERGCYISKEKTHEQLPIIHVQKKNRNRNISHIDSSLRHLPL